MGLMTLYCFFYLGHSQSLFLYFNLFNTVEKMTGFELRIYGIGSTRPTN